MDNYVLAILDRVERSPNQVFSSRRKNLENAHNIYQFLPARVRCFVLTWMATSSKLGWRLLAIFLTKSKSVSLAAGNPTSISLKPHLRRRLKNLVFCSTVIGLTRDWFPSRRSTAHQRGTLSIVLPGHVRSGRITVGGDWYFVDGRYSQKSIEYCVNFFHLFFQLNPVLHPQSIMAFSPTLSIPRVAWDPLKRVTQLCPNGARIILFE